MQLQEPSEGLQFTDPGSSHASLGFVQNELPKLMPAMRPTYDEKSSPPA
jgi:hypothetical protein